MSDGTNFYNRLLGYVLWINRKGASEPEQVYAMRGQKIGEKGYKVTLRNVKLYLEELKRKDPNIISIVIDRLSRVGELKWEIDDTTKDT